MDRIGKIPLRPGWGGIWQGGELADLDDIPEPKAIVSMVGVIAGFRHIFLATYINDTPESCLPPEKLFGMVDAAIGLLRNGINIYVHCLEGKSRSSYFTVALHMRILKIGYDDALKLVKLYHPLAQPNVGFEAQLRKLKF